MNNEEAEKRIRDAGITSEDRKKYFEHRFGKINNWEWTKEDIEIYIKNINDWKNTQKPLTLE